MYDWPEVRASTDALWGLMCQSFADHGFGDVPLALSRENNPHQDWLSPDLLLSQTCGLPFVRELQGRVHLLGTPSYDIDCGSGAYFSVLIGREGSAGSLSELSGYRFACNDGRSQSGYAAFLQAVMKQGASPPAQIMLSGSHRASVRLVAEGKADIAAIDAVTWALACRHEPAARLVTVFGQTEPMPGLPYITSLAFSEQAETLRLAISEAMAALSAGDRDALLLTGFVARQEGDYTPVREGWLEIEKRSWAQLPADE
jgi:ABC-type phosphate/phosphonate transport system substrate-binding protein